MTRNGRTRKRHGHDAPSRNNKNKQVTAHMTAEGDFVMTVRRLVVGAWSGLSFFFFSLIANQSTFQGDPVLALS